MTNTTGNTAAAGWYDDPSGSGQKRWWDGARWTDHLHDPSLEVYGAVATPVMGARTSVYNIYIWLVVLLPLLSIVSLMSFDMSGYLRGAMEGGNSLSGMLSPSYLLITALNWGIYLVMVLFAYLDSKKLGRDGFVRPFPWAWAFLSSAVYVIGRSVVAKRRSGRGLLPIWVTIAVYVITVVVAIVQVANMLSVMFSTFQFS
ncbi:MAG: DUF2510 domain-containing protein [Lacisediminihabitans sp.]